MGVDTLRAVRGERAQASRIRSVALLAIVLGCGSDEPQVLDGDMPIHLEAHLASATVEGEAPPADGQPSRVWTFPTAAPEWELVPASSPSAELRSIDGALELRIGIDSARKDRATASVMTSLPDWDIDDWQWVIVTLRATGAVRVLGLRFNRRGSAEGDDAAWQVRGDEVPVIADGSEHRYRLRVGLRRGLLGEDWRELGLHLTAAGAGRVELRKVEVVRTSARFALEAPGVSFEGRGDIYRRAVFTRAPTTLRYAVRVPDSGRLDFGLGVLDRREPVTFRVLAETGAGERRELFADSWSDAEAWGQRTIDLADLAGRTVSLGLETESAQPGTVGLWATPTLSGSTAVGRPDRPRPNILLYVIDGGGAELASVYGNPRPTTPFLEELAARGAVFERAHSNSSWTKPATSTLLTSLHHSSLGGTLTLADPLPESAVTLAELLHDVGYLTAAFTSNPFAGRVSNLERGLDRLRDADRGRNSDSSVRLHAAFRRWREENPGRPFFAHIQTTDVHRPHQPSGESVGRFLGDEQRRELFDQRRRLEAAGGVEPDSPAWELTGLDRAEYYAAQRLLVEECMAHNDAQLAELVRYLEAEGVWQDTLLIVTADHGPRAAGIFLTEAMPERVLASAHETRIPVIVTWPGRIAAGRRIEQPVSLIDVVPTVLELLSLPPLQKAQGTSWVPLLDGDREISAWPPVVLDELEVDRTSGELYGLIEVVDGPWAGSLKVGEAPLGSGLERPPVGRTSPFLLFDLERDPNARHSLHEERPDLVRRYVTLLRKTLEEHVGAAEAPAAAERSELTADQLDTLRSLGYIQ